MAVIYQSINDSNRIRMLYWNDQGSPINPENRSGKDSNEISWDGREVASRALGHVRIVIERITVDARAYVRKSCWHLDTRFLSLFSLWCASPSYPTENSIVKYFTGGHPFEIVPIYFWKIHALGFSSQTDRFRTYTRRMVPRVSRSVINNSVFTTLELRWQERKNF